MNPYLYLLLFAIGHRACEKFLKVWKTDIRDITIIVGGPDPKKWLSSCVSLPRKNLRLDYTSNRREFPEFLEISFLTFWPVVSFLVIALPWQQITKNHTTWTKYILFNSITMLNQIFFKFWVLHKFDRSYNFLTFFEK